MSMKIWKTLSFMLRYGAVFFLGFLAPIVSAVVAGKGGIEKARQEPERPPNWRDRAAEKALSLLDTLDTGAGEA